LERLIPRLSERDLRVGVLKHDAHKLDLDRPGKDTARLWDAGAHVVLAHDGGQRFLRSRPAGDESIHSFADVVRSAGYGIDLLLVEGHKSTPLPKIWLGHPEIQPPPDELENVAMTLAWGDPERVEKAERAITDWLDEAWKRVPLSAGILVGGKSVRMGTPKAAVPWRGATLLEYIVSVVREIVPESVLVGESADVPHLGGVVSVPDVAENAGPMGGIVGAMRWRPEHAWLFVACDMPHLSPAALEWLLSRRAPGRWGVLPEIGDRPQPLCAVYEPPARDLFERSLRAGQLSLRNALRHPKIHRVSVPADLAPAWTNCNTPEEWNQAIGEG